jgi:hypothetical protein
MPPPSSAATLLHPPAQSQRTTPTALTEAGTKPSEVLSLPSVDSLAPRYVLPFSSHLLSTPTNPDLTNAWQNLKQQGDRQNAEGKAQEAKGQLNDLGSGIANRVTGAVGGAVAGIAGDRDAQLKAQDQHDIGKTQQRGAEYDIQKQNQ